jgi:hypothetical protein
MDATNPIPQQTIVLTPTKRCPKGYSRIKGTRHCKRKGSASAPAPIKTTKVTQKPSLEVTLGADQKKCPKGYRKIRGTRRCKREGDASANKTAKVTHKRYLEVVLDADQKKCPKGYKRKPGTKICIKQAPKKTTMTKTVRLKSPVRRTLKTRSPTINKRLLTKYALPLSPRQVDIVGKGDNVNKIKITDPDRNAQGQLVDRWVSWNSKAAKDAMLRNFRNPVKLNCSSVVGPKQYFSNCWFNTFFMSFFISDKGRKTYRHLRQTMITGIIPQTDTAKQVSIRTPYRKPLFYMNALIESCLHGLSHGIASYDTNEIVKGLNAASRRIIREKKSPSAVYAPVFPKLREYSNPITFYKKLLTALEQGSRRDLVRFDTILIDIEFIREAFKSNVKHPAGVLAYRQKLLKNMMIWWKYTKGVVPHSICIENDEISDIRGLGDASVVKWWVEKGRATYGFNDSFTLKDSTGKEHTYALDSSVLRNVNKRHFGCFLTCGSNEFMFDGAQPTTQLTPVKWKKYAAGDSQTVITDSQTPHLSYSFSTSYHASFYYLVE